MVKQMTEGSPFKLILGFSVPLMIGSIFQQMYSMVDTVIVGRTIGKQALAAVGATGSITFLIIGFMCGIAEGACILVAQYFGAGDVKSIKRCVGNIIYVSIGTVAVLTIIALLTNRPMLEALNTPPDIINDSEKYLRVIYVGMAASMLYNVLAGLLRALGDSRSPLYFLLVASGLNVVLDIAFIVGCGMGVEGAAYATVISQMVSAVCCLVYIKKKCPILFLSRDDLRLRGQMISKICFMAFPMALQYSVTALGTVFVSSVLNPLGSDVVAAVTLSDKILSFYWPIVNSVGVAVANFSGQNIGAARLDRLKRGVRDGGIMIAAFTLVSGLVFFFFGTGAALLFLENGDGESVRPLIELYIKIQSAMLPALGMIALFRNAVQGMGFSIHAMSAGMIELVGRTSLALGFVGTYGYTAICLASPIAWVLAGVLLLILYTILITRLGRRHPDWLGAK